MDISGVVNYYVNLLITQYHDQPKAKAQISLFVNELLANGIDFAVRDAFNVESAIGVQLDVVGKYVGLTRFYNGQALTGYFDFTNYNEFPLDPTKTGFTNYAATNPAKGQTLNYLDYLSNNTALNDNDFRTLIYLRIVQNNINHSRGAIDAALYEFFGNTLYGDSAGNMAMAYFYSGNILPALIIAAFQKGLLPKPLGVRLNYIIKHTYPLFGFATYAAGAQPTITGFTNYTNGFTNSGETLNYSKANTG
jgi:hypothetical protein